jgi:hypothetical protein
MSPSRQCRPRASSFTNLHLHRRCGAGEHPFGHPSRVLRGELPGGSGDGQPFSQLLAGQARIRIRTPAGSVEDPGALPGLQRVVRRLVSQWHGPGPSDILQVQQVGMEPKGQLQHDHEDIQPEN